MSLIHTRDAILRRGVVHNTVLLLSVIAAVVVGLLGMHTFASSMDSHEGSTAAAMVMGGPAAHVDESSAGDGVSTAAACSGVCDPSHSMTTMACILALLFTALTLVAARGAGLSALLPRVRRSHLRTVAFAARIANAPPDLNVLSISRT